MGVSSTITASFALMLFMAAMANLLTLSSEIRGALIELSNSLEGRGCVHRYAELGVSRINGSELEARLILWRGCGLRLRDLASSDIYIYYKTVAGAGGFSRLRPGVEWVLVNVRAPGGVELLNPSNPAAWEGILDPSEEAVILVRLPDDVDVEYGVALVLVTPDGDRVMGAG
ncbi:MAG: hypothetical protein RMJ28_07095 [Nitrososphaerota archaeon]|nr:hypothetical protein [Candidatus Calditenuaceae archaeon]MDW8073980.1 hypothetical protein [Nitrososphaerota archaeon]